MDLIRDFLNETQPRDVGGDIQWKHVGKVEKQTKKYRELTFCIQFSHVQSVSIAPEHIMFRSDLLPTVLVCLV